MPLKPLNPDPGSDLDQLLSALSAVSSLATPDGFLRTVGLGDMPPAQRYGMMFGIVVFVCTVTAVLALLILGGTFRRLAEQAKEEGGGGAVPTSVKAREGRPLMLERLLEARERMVGRYDVGEGPRAVRFEGTTRLTESLLNVSPSLEKIERVPDLVDDGERGRGGGALNRIIGSNGPKKRDEADPDAKRRRREEIRRDVPEGYEENYVSAYRTCRDRPGGPPLSGLPDARPEAYARSYAGCGARASPSYRRSYARIYESLACATHASEKEFRYRFRERPGDLVGGRVRLEALEASRHSRGAFDATCGDAFLGEGTYDPRLVWGYLDCGPFGSPEEMGASGVFRRRKDEGAFAIVETAADAVVGVVVLAGDDSRNLSVQLEPPILNPSKDGSAEQIEACFLLLDRLFALGYRRVQMTVDTQDEVSKKLPGRLGFTQEGTIPKHMIVRDSNRDSNVYGLLNSDWDRGARSFLFGKIHGPKARRADELNDKREAEYDEWRAALKRQAEEKARAREEEEKKD